MWSFVQSQDSRILPRKDGLFKGKVAQVDLENNSQNTQPILTL